jgi:leader peptidase (prepilin peptidase) / N-methyltransferase
MVYIIFIYGLFIGSFLNVLIDRLPEGEQVLRGRSHCDHCKRNLNWYELIPLFSFIFQKGRSHCCHRKLSLQYPLIELITGIGFGIIYYFFSGQYQLFDNSFISLFHYSIILVSYLIIFSAFLVIFVSDFKTFIIPDSMLVVLLFGVIINKIMLFYPTYYIQYTIYLPYFLSALGAFIFFMTIFLATRGRGMGFGDVKLAPIIGLFLGYPLSIFAIYAAFLTGAFIGVILVIVHRKSMKSQLPFGPFLIVGVAAAIILQPIFLVWWKGVI